jgi:hypothetical protein
MTPFRILVTGWRDWPKEDADLVGKVLHCYVIAALAEGFEVVVVDGECEYGGADQWAHDWVVQYGSPLVTSERHPAERHPKTGRILGPQRNAKMVSLGADVCLAFPGPGNNPRSGTRNCMNQAMAAGIPTVTNIWGEPLRYQATLDGTRTFPQY